MSKNSIGIAILGLVLVAALALPVSAAATSSGNGQAGQINSGLKNDLWNTYGQYRLQIYDTRVQGANAIVTVLGNYGCPTSDLQATVTSIGNERTALSDALTNHDRNALKTVNQQLTSLWQQFRQQARASIKSCSAQPVTANPQETTDSAGL